jgi:hypothetical protein
MAETEAVLPTGKQSHGNAVQLYLNKRPWQSKRLKIGPDSFPVTIHGETWLEAEDSGNALHRKRSQRFSECPEGSRTLEFSPKSRRKT